MKSGETGHAVTLWSRGIDYSGGPEGLAHREHTLHHRQVGRVYVRSLPEVALAGLALLGEEVLLKSLRTLDFTRAGNLESLLRAAVGLELRHGGPFFGTAKVRIARGKCAICF